MALQPACCPLRQTAGRDGNIACLTEASVVQLDGESGGKPKGKLGFANPLNLKPHAAPGNREPQHSQPQMYDTVCLSHTLQCLRPAV